MNLQKKVEKGVLVLTPNKDRIDVGSAIFLKDQFREAIAGFEGRVLMDLSGVQFMDSSGLGAMVSALKLLKGRTLEIAGLSPVVAKVFKLTLMDQVFVVHPDMASAFGPSDGADAA